MEGSPLDSPAYLSTQHSHASVSETFAFTPDIFTHVSISWIQYPVWNYERDWIFFFFFDVVHCVCLFILGWAGSLLLHTGICLDAMCGLLTVVSSPAAERSLEGEGFRVCAHRLHCCTARGIRQDRGSSSCPLHRQGDSHPLYHQGSLMKTMCKQTMLHLWPHCFCFLFWFFGHEACGILVPRPGIEPACPCVGRWSLNHWTASKIPRQGFSYYLCWISFPRSLNWQPLGGAMNKRGGPINSWGIAAECGLITTWPEISSSAPVSKG